ncbi:MAG: tetratricopeptide repeat protein [Bacteroidaceae bacterium]|nr:tetratricopeptide repeat protein [Bacteroidaceae bacterium]
MDNKSYFDSTEFREILKKYEQTREKQVCSYFEIEDLLDILVYYLFQDSVEAAEEVLAHAITLHPTAPELTKMEVKILLAKNEPEKALIILGSKGFPDDDDSILLQAQVFIALKDYREARDIALDILNKKQANKEIICEALEILLDGGYAQEALEITNSGLARYHKHPSLLEIKAECLIELQDTNGAISIYNELLDSDPYSTFYWEQLAHIYYLTNRYGKALECYEYELAINDEIDYARMMQGYCYYFMRDYEKAFAIFNNLVEKYRQSVMPLFYKAMCLWHLNEEDEALKTFRDIAKTSEDGSIEAMVALVNCAIILSRRGDTDSASRPMSFALFLHPSNLKQLLVSDEELYTLRDKENLTFKEMNVIDIKEWSEDESLFALAMHLIEYQHYEIACRTLFYIKETSAENADIDACIAYAMYNTGREDEIREYVETALAGKSNLLFDLFGLIYDAQDTADTFLNKIAE